MTGAALSSSSTITISIIGFFAFLVIVVLARSLMRKDGFRWQRIRIGFFIERDPGDSAAGSSDDDLAA